MYLCVFSVEIQTIAMKFGTEVVNGLGRFGGWGCSTP